jgi:hypothetical protein
VAVPRSLLVGILRRIDELRPALNFDVIAFENARQLRHKLVERRLMVGPL